MTQFEKALSELKIADIRQRCLELAVSVATYDTVQDKGKIIETAGGFYNFIVNPEPTK